MITGVVVAGLSAHGHHATLDDLGVSWLIAVAVSFTISLELVLLVVRSLASPLRDLRAATEQVRAGDFSARVPVVATDETGALARSFNMMVEGLDERERLRTAFGAYVDPDVAERVLREGADLAGEELEVTVLFLDIRDFTAIAERSEPSEVVALLNDLWALVVPVCCVTAATPTSSSATGCWPCSARPSTSPTTPTCAVRAALEIAAVVREHYAGEIGVGIGVNTGPVVAGTVGGGGRVEFTVIGDAVNMAARVEAATRETGDDVLITDATSAVLPDGAFTFERRPGVELAGRKQEVDLWAPAAAPNRCAWPAARVPGPAARVPGPAVRVPRPAAAGPWCPIDLGDPACGRRRRR